jgi:histone-lysine N-methyltransferase SUV39H
VQAFDEDFPEAADIAGRSMRGRLPYAPYAVGPHRVCMLAHDSAVQVHECNARCSCGPQCRSRVLQHGLRARLFLRPAQRHGGWGVHAAAFIPAGAFVVEYVAELLSAKEADVRGREQDREGVSYLFAIDSHKEAGAAGAADVFTLDASHAGNVARFINHSCAPNCRIRSVIWDSSDPRLAHLALYALKDIEPAEELTYHYRYTVKKGSKSGIKCKCGASNCRGWLVTF